MGPEERAKRRIRTSLLDRVSQNVRDTNSSPSSISTGVAVWVISHTAEIPVRPMFAGRTAFGASWARPSRAALGAAHARSRNCLAELAKHNHYVSNPFPFSNESSHMAISLCDLSHLYSHRALSSRRSEVRQEWISRRRMLRIETSCLMNNNATNNSLYEPTTSHAKTTVDSEHGLGLASAAMPRIQPYLATASEGISREISHLDDEKRVDPIRLVPHGLCARGFQPTPLSHATRDSSIGGLGARLYGKIFSSRA